MSVRISTSHYKPLYTWPHKIDAEHVWFEDEDTSKETARPMKLLGKWESPFSQSISPSSQFSEKQTKLSRRSEYALRNTPPFELLKVLKGVYLTVMRLFGVCLGVWTTYKMRKLIDGRWNSKMIWFIRWEFKVGLFYFCVYGKDEYKT